MQKTGSNSKNEDVDPIEETRLNSALKHLFCGGTAGAAAKTLTAPLSRLTILFQVHSMVTTKENRPKFSMTLSGGMKKIVERGGIHSLWKGNGTSVLHRFPFSAINFFVYENILDLLMGINRRHEDEDGRMDGAKSGDPPKLYRLLSGAVAGSTACIACYPLDLVRTRLTTELPGKEQYRGIFDAFRKILSQEGPRGLYAGLGPTLLVAVPNFSISYTVYGSLKEYVLDDDLFYNLRKIDDESGQESMGLQLSLLCGAASGTMASMVTFPFDTIRRRMQIQNLHLDEEHRLTARRHVKNLFQKEGIYGIYRGLTPELIKVVPMVGTMFFVYETLKDKLKVTTNR
jgi:solute carrier family 25 phosphate transporter 23/24/25/41